MPENNPLPIDLRVRDYLDFRAQLKHLSKDMATKRIDEVVDQCGISNVANRYIGQLSRGYRQRVGMADALLANPELIILDEPTSGLDPNQVRSVRSLIRKLSGKHTVLISSHILSEIEMTCDRVVILHEGKLLASGEMKQLISKSNLAVVAEICAPLNDIKNWASEIALEKSELIEQKNGYVRCRFSAIKNNDIREQIFTIVNERGWELRELSLQTPSLEDLFVSLTNGEEGNR